MSGLRVDELSVVYPTQPPIVAVDRATMHVDRGEIVALLGPSGCGKSSLLAAVVGLVPPAHGSITWDDQDLTTVPTHLRRFGLVFQDGVLFPHRTVAGNVGYGLAASGMRKSERTARVTKLLALVGLEGFEERSIDTLSGGQRQRVALARSLAPEPRLLCLDEPLASLDDDLRTRIGLELREVLVSTNSTAILVTHDPLEAARIADRVVQMSHGRIDGRP